jgi:excisionase family DNA binding protein
MESRKRKESGKALTEMQKARLDRLAEHIKELPEERADILMGEIQQIYSIKEAAKLLSCHPETLRRAIRQGRLEAGKLGKDYRISRVDLMAYYKRQGGGELFE